MNIGLLFRNLKVPHRGIKSRRPSNARRPNPRGGFTLIESVLTIGLVSIGMTGVFYLMAVGTDMNINTREEMLAYQAANGYMDFLRQQPFTSLTNTTNAAFGQTTGANGYQALSQLSNAQGAYTISTFTAGTDPVKQITVTVRWSRRSVTRNRSVSVSTLAVKGGLNERWK